MFSVAASEFATPGWYEIEFVVALLANAANVRVYVTPPNYTTQGMGHVRHSGAPAADFGLSWFGNPATSTEVGSNSSLGSSAGTSRLVRGHLLFQVETGQTPTSAFTVTIANSYGAGNHAANSSSYMRFRLMPPA